MKIDDQSPNQLDAIITAGGIPMPGEPLYEYTNGKPKALLDFFGKPMIQWVLDAVSSSKFIRKVIVVGLPPKTKIHCSHPLLIIETKGSILLNLKAGVDELIQTGGITQKVLAISSDIPAITGQMVDWVIDQVSRSDHDLYYNVISRESMVQKFPNSRRTYIKLKDSELCGGDLNAFDHNLVYKKQELFEDLIGSRKNPLKQASILGLDTLLLLFFKQMTLAKAEINIGRKIGARVKALICPYAEIGMDIDKNYQLEELLTSYETIRVSE